MQVREGLHKLINEMRSEIPGCIAVGFFDIKSGKILDYAFNIPGSDPENASRVHAGIFEKVENFLKFIPEDITGKLQAMSLVVEGAFFYLVVDDKVKVAVMAASTSPNFGLLKTVSKMYLSKVVNLLS